METNQSERGKDFQTWEDHIRHLPRATLPEIYDWLNRWEWHPLLGQKPDGWDEMPQLEKYQGTKEIFSCIEARCSEKELLRYYHMAHFGSTGTQFNDWWDSMVLSELREEMQNHSGRHPENGIVWLISAISIAAAVLSLAAIAMQLC